jgi:hypothetical protein
MGKGEAGPAGQKPAIALAFGPGGDGPVLIDGCAPVDQLLTPYGR